MLDLDNLLALLGGLTAEGVEQLAAFAPDDELTFVGLVARVHVPSDANGGRGESRTLVLTRGPAGTLGELRDHAAVNALRDAAEIVASRDSDDEEGLSIA